MKRRITFTHFSAYPQIKHAISTKDFDTMKKADGTIHHANMLKFVTSIAHHSLGICMQQVHSGNVSIVENDYELVIADSDALITNKKNLALTVMVADCVPLLFFDPVTQVIAALHAGSKGLKRRIIENTLNVMEEKFDVNPANVLVGIGPSIEQSCYEVAESFAQEYQLNYPHCNNLVAKNGEKYYLNVVALTNSILITQGISEHNIETIESCTKCNQDTLYSFRRGDTTERFAAFIARE